MRMFIEAPRLLTGDGEVLSNQVLIVEDGRVTAIEERSRIAPAGSREGGTYSIHGGTIIPGLIDAHTHLTCTPGDGAEFTKGLSETPEALLLRAASNAVDALSGGITTIRDCGSKPFLDLAIRDAVRRKILPGPRVLLCAGLVTTTRGHMHYWGTEADTAEELRRVVRSRAKVGADFIKIMATGGYPHEGANNPTRAQYDVATLRAAVDEAERLGLPVATHCLATEGIVAAIGAGAHTIEHALFLGEKGFTYAPQVADILASRGIPVSNAIVGWHRRLHSSRHLLSAEEVSSAERLHHERVEHLRDMMARGVRFIGGSDAGMPLTPFHDLALILELSVRDLGMNPTQAINSCTSDAAKALGVCNDLGSLRPGRFADFALIRGDPLQNISAVRKVAMVFIEGRPVWSSSPPDGVEVILPGGC